jgi:hypothetical protein
MSTWRPPARLSDPSTAFPSRSKSNSTLRVSSLPWVSRFRAISCLSPDHARFAAFVSRIGHISSGSAVVVSLLESLGAIPHCRTNIPQTLLVSFACLLIFERRC